MLIMVMQFTIIRNTDDKTKPQQFLKSKMSG